MYVGIQKKYDINLSQCTLNVNKNYNPDPLRAVNSIPPKKNPVTQNCKNCKLVLHYIYSFSKFG